MGMTWKTRGGWMTTALMIAVLMAGCGRKTEETVSITPPPADKPGDPDMVMAEVNGVKLTLGELDKQVEEQFEQVAMMVPPQQAEAYRKQVRAQAVQGFIATTLLEGEADKRGIRVTEKDMDAAVETITRNFPEGMTLETALDMQDMSMDEFKTRLGKDLRIKKLFDEEMDKSGAVTEEDVKLFYEEHKDSMDTPEMATARHILIRIGEEEDDEAAKAGKKAKLEALRLQIVEGADFGELAKANSDCPSGKDGGMLPKFGRGQMAPEFEEAAFTQELDAVGPLVETQFGYHLVQVLGREEGKTRSLEESRSQIMDYLRMMKGREIIPPFIDSLRAAAAVSLDPALEAEMKMAQAEMEMGGFDDEDWEEDDDDHEGHDHGPPVVIEAVEDDEGEEAAD